MAPWLTFVVGIILGLVIGWLIDMLYRRASGPTAKELPDRTPDWARPLPAETPAPQLPGVATASAVAVAAATEDDGLDVPPGSQTSAATDEVDWRAISERVDAVADEVPPPPASVPRIRSEMPDEEGAA
jgi:hypothetical protein